jgi:hypothetical protein
MIAPLSFPQSPLILLDHQIVLAGYRFKYDWLLPLTYHRSLFHVKVPIFWPRFHRMAAGSCSIGRKSLKEIPSLF